MKLTYTGETEQVFPDVKCADGTTLLAVPGHVYDLETNPDDSVFSASRAPASSSAVETVAEVEGSPSSSTPTEPTE